MEQVQNNWWERVMVKEVRRNNMEKQEIKRKWKEGGKKDKEGVVEKKNI